MFSKSDKLQAKLYAQAQIDLLKMLVGMAMLMVVFNSIVACINAKFLITITQERSN